MSTDDTVIPFFVYGTARKFCALWWMVEPMVEADALASAPQMLLMAEPGGEYPYMTRCYKPEVKVWGDLLLLRNGPRLEELVRMEQSAGYQLEGIKVDHNMRGVGPVALSFLWTRDTHGMEVIESGSWLAGRYMPSR